MTAERFRVALRRCVVAVAPQAASGGQTGDFQADIESTGRGDELRTDEARVFHTGRQADGLLFIAHCNFD